MAYANKMMNPARKRKLLIVLFLLSILSISTCLFLYAMGQNVSLFYNPHQIAQGQAPIKATIRIGGMVVPGSLEHSNTDLMIHFAITDYKDTVKVQYEGVLPDLFREGKGVVARGKFDPKKGIFNATEILAKHDENYMPPEVKHAIS